jgi:hypothetical protein
MLQTCNSCDPIWHKINIISAGSLSISRGSLMFTVLHITVCIYDSVFFIRLFQNGGSVVTCFLKIECAQLLTTRSSPGCIEFSFWESVLALKKYKINNEIFAIMDVLQKIPNKPNAKQNLESPSMAEWQLPPSFYYYNSFVSGFSTVNCYTWTLPTWMVREVDCWGSGSSHTRNKSFSWFIKIICRA